MTVEVNVPYVKGQSGNLRGGPLKNRALTAILEQAGAVTVDDADGHRVARKRLISALVWEVATTGRATFPDGTLLQVAPQDWLGLVKWIYTQIDGPAPQAIQLDIRREAEQVAARYGVDPDKVVSIYEQLKRAG